MGPVYATRLVVYSDTTHPADQFFATVVEVCHTWLQRVATRYGLELPGPPDADFSVANHAIGARFSGEHFSVDGSTAWRAIGLHPFDTPAGDLQMRIELQVRYSGGSELDITIRLLLGAIVDTIRPVNIDIRPPSLVRMLLEAFPGLVSSGNIKASGDVTYLDESGIQDLCEKIFKPNRLVPIVVISRMENEQLALSNESIVRIAQDVAGFARVYVLPSFQVGYQLTDFLSKPLSCYLGAIRIYWPGFTQHDSPFHHTLYTVQRMEDEHLKPIMWKVLFDAIASASALAIGSDPETWRLYRSHTARQQEAQTALLLERMRESSRALEEDRSLDQTAGKLLSEATMALQEASPLRQSLAVPSDESWGKLKQDLEVAEVLLNETAIRIKQEMALKQDAEDLLAVALDDMTRYDQRTREHEAYISELETRNAKLDAQVSWLQKKNGTTGEDRDAIGLCTELLALKTVHDVVAFVESISDAASLVFLQDAFESARACSYARNLQQVLATLLKIQRVARRYHDGMTLGHKALFEAEEEYDYRANISDTARNEFRADYEKRYDHNGVSEQIMLGPHINIGPGRPENSLSIFWYVDTLERKYVVGHVGRHLRGKRPT